MSIRTSWLALRRRMRMQLDEIEHSDGALAATMEAEAKARAAYDDAAAQTDGEAGSARRRSWRRPSPGSWPR